MSETEDEAPEISGHVAPKPAKFEMPRLPDVAEEAPARAHVEKRRPDPFSANFGFETALILGSTDYPVEDAVLI